MNAETVTMIIAIWLIVLCAGLAWMALKDGADADKWLDEYEREYEERTRGK